MSQEYSSAEEKLKIIQEITHAHHEDLGKIKELLKSFTLDIKDMDMLLDLRITFETEGKIASIKRMREYFPHTRLLKLKNTIERLERNYGWVYRSPTEVRHVHQEGRN